MQPATPCDGVMMCEEHFDLAARTPYSSPGARHARNWCVKIPNRGFVVPEFGSDDIVDITRLRGAIEGEVRTLLY